MQKNEEIIVSICCITYNHASFIHQCIDGFLMQKTNFKYEIIIHDDCSTDGTTEIVKEYASKFPDLIVPIYQEKNQYQNGNRRILASFVYPIVRGKYVAYCEGDDYWTDPYKLQKQVDILESDPECSLVYTSFRRYVQDENRFLDDVIVEKEGNLYKNFFSANEEESVDIDIQTVTLCIRKEVLNNLPPIPEDAFAGDQYICITACFMGHYRIVKDITSVYRILRNSACHFTDKASVYKLHYEVEKMKIAILKSHPVDDIVLINSLKFRYINDLIHYSLLTNNFEVYKDFHSDKKYFGKFKHRIKLFIYYFFREKHLFHCLSWIYRKLKK